METVEFMNQLMETDIILHMVSGFGINSLASKEMIRALEDRNTSQGAIFRLYWLTTGEVSAEWKGIGGSMPIGTTCNLYLALVRGQIYIAPDLPF